jgi:hypothetical protein
VYLLSGENISEGVEVMKTALRLDPQNKRFAMTLAELQLRVQDYAGAKKTLEPLVASDDDSGLRAQAKSMMGMIDSYLRPDTSGGSLARVESPAESGNRPRLLRKGEGPLDQPEPASDKTDRALPSARPTLKIEGTQIMAGTLAAIECGAGMVLAVKTGDKLLRFTVTDTSKLQFLTQDPQLNPNIGCGPINLAAYIHYKPISGGKFAGDAVAVEFRK